MGKTTFLLRISVLSIGAIIWNFYLSFILFHAENTSNYHHVVSISPPHRHNRQPIKNLSSSSHSQQRHRRLIHVISPFHDKSASSDFFEPFNLEQWSMLVSIHRARDSFNSAKLSPAVTEAKREVMTDKGYQYRLFDEVDVVCAVLDADIEALQDNLSPYCQHLIGLSRSTETEYNGERKQKALPFLQDMINAATKTNVDISGGNDGEFWVMITNADISLTHDFYNKIGQHLIKRNANALSINRMTVDSSLITMPSARKSKHEVASNIVQQANAILKQGKGESHPGYDCFIFHSSILRMIRFGKMFVGYPPWGANINLALKIMAKNYANIESNPNGTFHLGNSRSWHNPSKTDSSSDDLSFWYEKTLDNLEYLPWCPISNHPPKNEYILGNSINCGKWFRPRSSTKWSLRHHLYHVPAFVRDGFQDVYINNFSKYMNHTSKGMPLVAGFPSPKMKQRIPKAKSPILRLITYLVSQKQKKIHR
jgi:hypothetical protein